MPTLMIEPPNVVSDSIQRPKRSIEDILAPLNDQARNSINLLAVPGARFETDGQNYELPRYVFLGPTGGDEPLRIGIFAGIHGDETAGIYALVKFLTWLDANPQLVTGYRLYAYPVCNPTGFEDNTRHSRNGHDLNREFWQGSKEPEVQLLQAELSSHAFHGIIALHSDDTSDGLYGFVSGSLLTKHLLEPALAVAETILPRNEHDNIDGFSASRGIIHKGYQGILSAPPKVRPRPFEIVLETPQLAPHYLQENAVSAALLVILEEYRKFIAYSPNL